MKTLQEALTLVPTYWPLVPGVDKWKEGDEVFHEDRIIQSWLKVNACNFGQFIENGGSNPYRRPIPQSVREAEAFWILHGKPFNPPSGSKIDALGGMDNIQKHYDEGPGALWRWVEENRK